MPHSDISSADLALDYAQRDQNQATRLQENMMAARIEASEWRQKCWDAEDELFALKIEMVGLRAKLRMAEALQRLRKDLAQ